MRLKFNKKRILKNGKLIVIDIIEVMLSRLKIIKKLWFLIIILLFSIF